MKNERKFFFLFITQHPDGDSLFFCSLSSSLCLPKYFYYLLFYFKNHFSFLPIIPLNIGFGQVVSCDSNEIIVSIDEEITPITCTVSIASQPISIYPDLPNGLTFSNNVISGKPISSYPMTTHYVSSRLTSFPIKIAVYGEPTSLTYGFDYVTLYKGVSFEPFVPVSDAPLTGYSVSSFVLYIVLPFSLPFLMECSLMLLLVLFLVLHLSTLFLLTKRDSLLKEPTINTPFLPPSLCN